MRKTDFTKPGGFPLNQDQLDYMQQAYIEAINALGAIGGDINEPLAISGMEVTNDGNTVANGWFFYQGELIKFIGSIVAPAGTDVALVEITPTAATLDFNDGSSPAVILDKTATIITGATVTDATHFPVSSLKVWRQKHIIESAPYAYGSGGVPAVVNLRRDRTIIASTFWRATGGAPAEMTIDMTGAVPGSVLTIYVPANGLGSFGVTINCSATVLNPISGHGNLKGMLTIKYLGNLGGTDYVYMELNEWF